MKLPHHSIPRQTLIPCEIIQPLLPDTSRSSRKRYCRHSLYCTLLEETKTKT